MEKCKDCKLFDSSKMRRIAARDWGVCHNGGPFLREPADKPCVAFKKKGDNNHV